MRLQMPVHRGAARFSLGKRTWQRDDATGQSRDGTEHQCRLASRARTPQDGLDAGTHTACAAAVTFIPHEMTVTNSTCALLRVSAAVAESHRHSS